VGEGEEWGGVSAHSQSEAEENSDEEEVPELLQPISSTPQTGTAYVPPHMRAKTSEVPSEALLRLSRNLKGLLNRYVRAYSNPTHISTCISFRMSEQNIGAIIDSIEQVYQDNKRHGKASQSWLLIESNH
jgi:nucleolar MIF4G domain-containing protein 1